MPIEKSVGAVVFRCEKKKTYFLLLQHPPSKRNNVGQWSFPKGHIEKGETWDETLRREVKEETGISRVNIIPEFYAWIKYFYRASGSEAKRRRKEKEGLNVFKIVTYYLAETKIKKIKLSFEHTNCAWLEYKKALDRITYKSTRNILKKAHKYLIKHNII